MFVSKVSFEVVAVAAILFFAIALPAVQAQPSGAPAPAPGPTPAPTSDETIPSNWISANVCGTGAYMPNSRSRSS